MNIPFPTVVALCLALLYAGGASGAKEYVYDKDSAAVETPKATQISDVQTNHSNDAVKAFSDRNLVHDSVSPFTPNEWKKPKPRVMRSITNNNCNTLLKYALKDKISTGEPKCDAMKKAKDFFGGLAAKDIAACQSENCMKCILETVMFCGEGSLSKTAKEAINGYQVYKLVGYINDATTSIIGGGSPKDKDKEIRAVWKKLDFLPDPVRKTYAPVLVKTAGDNVQYFTSDSSNSMLKSVLSESRACAELTPDSLKYVIEKKASLLTSACLAQVKDKLITMAFGDKVKLSLPKDSLKEYNGNLTENFIQLLSKDNLNNFASAFKDIQLPGKDLDTAKISNETIKGLSKAVFLGRLNALPDASSPFFGTPEAAKNAPVNVITDVTSEDGFTALSHLSSSDLNALPYGFIQEIANKHPQLCGKFGPDTATISSIHINNPECFRNMTGEAQGFALAKAKSLHDDCLVHVTADKVSSWSASTNKGDSMSGIDVLGARPNMSNIGKLIKGLGADPDGRNPCETFDSYSIFDSVKVLADHITAQCFNAAQRDAPDKDAKIAERLKILMPYSILSQREKEFFTKMTKQTLTNLADAGNFCPFVEPGIWNLVNLEAMSGMTGGCLEKLAVIEILTQAQVAAFPGDSFHIVPANRIPARIIPFMTTSHIKGACSAASDPEQRNLGVIFNAEVIQALSTDQISAILAIQWGGAPPDAFKGIDKEKIKACPASETELWKLSQVKEISADAIGNLSVAQAELIGAKASPHDSPVKYLYEHASVTDEVRAVLVKRLPDSVTTAGAAGATGIPTWVWYVVGAIIAIAIVAGVVFFFMRN